MVGARSAPEHARVRVPPGRHLRQLTRPIAAASARRIVPLALAQRPISTTAPPRRTPGSGRPSSRSALSGHPVQIGGYRLSSGTQRKLQTVTRRRRLRTPDRRLRGPDSWITKLGCRVQIIHFGVFRRSWDRRIMSPACQRRGQQYLLRKYEIVTTWPRICQGRARSGHSEPAAAQPRTRPVCREREQPRAAATDGPAHADRPRRFAFAR